MLQAMTDPRWLDAEESRAWRTLVIANARLMAKLDAELIAEHGISLPDYEVLMHLSEALECRLRMTELAQLVHLSPSGLTRRVDRLVRAQLVTREQCFDDRRGSFAVLSALGEGAVRMTAPVHLRGVRQYLIDLLARDELTTLANVMTAVMTACGPLHGVDSSLHDAGRPNAR